MRADPGTLSAVTAELVRTQQVANARQVALVRAGFAALGYQWAEAPPLAVRGKTEPIRTFIPSRLEA